MGSNAGSGNALATRGDLHAHAGRIAEENRCRSRYGGVTVTRDGQRYRVTANAALQPELIYPPARTGS